jgi:hypothetical protein
MNPSPDKTLTAEERFDTACVAHGLTPDDVHRIGLSPGGQDVLFGIVKEARITKEEYEANFYRVAADIRGMRAAIDVLAYAVTGAGIGAATAGVREFAKECRLSWKGFAQHAPKSTTIGSLLGGLVGVVSLGVANRERQHWRRMSSAQWDEREAAWQKREAKEKAAASQSTGR